MTMIVDSHQDIAWNALAEGRGFTGTPAAGYLVSRQALADAGVGLVFATVFTAPAGTRWLHLPYGYRTAREAYLLARSQVSYYESVGLPLIRTREQLQDYSRSWRPGQLAAVLLMENADPIESPRQVGEWFDRGLRVVGPAWARTRYCGGTMAPGGLTEAGRRLLRALRRHAVILDLSHMADRSVRDSLELWTGPLVASHVGARALCDRQRQVPDDVVREIAARDGLLGVSLYGGHLRLEPPASIGDVVEHAAHFARVAGDTRFVGLGSDLDGGFGAELAAIDSLADLSSLRRALTKRFGVDEADGIMGGNWLRFLGAALPSAA